MLKMKWFFTAGLHILIIFYFFSPAQAIPEIFSLNPVFRIPKKNVVIKGAGFGDAVDRGKVHLGDKTFGRKSKKVKLWSDTKIKLRIPDFTPEWFGGEPYKAVKIWVTTATEENSNKKNFWIVDPAASTGSVLSQQAGPDGNVAGHSDWTPSEGTEKYLLVSDKSDNTYVKSLNTGFEDFYAFEDPDAVGYPLAVRLWVRARSNMDDTRYRQIELLISIDGKDSSDITDPNDPGNKVLLTDQFEDYYVEWKKNTLDSENPIKWRWEDIRNLVGGVKSTTDASGGGAVSEVWLEVLCGDSKKRSYLSHGPVFGGVTSNSIGVWTKVQPRNGKKTQAKIQVRYGTVEQDVKDNAGDTRSTQVMTVNASTDYASTTTVSDLASHTLYFFDVLVDGVTAFDLASSAGNPYWDTLPRCQTAQLSDTDTDFDFVAGGDIHSPVVNHEVYASIAQKSPAFYLDLGDHTTDTNGDAIVVSRKLLKLRTFEVPGRHLVYHVLSAMPFFRIWSDHDAVANNGHKFGYFDEVTEQNVFAGLSNSLDGFLQYSPVPDLAAPQDLRGVASEGSDAMTLVDMTGPFDTTIHPGMVVSKTTEGGQAYSFVASVTSGTRISLSQPLSDAQVFNTGDEYRIHRGGLWYSFKYANAEFFVIDTRYKRDPNNTPGGDMLDGRRYISDDLSFSPKAQGTTDGQIPNGLIDNEGAFLSTVNQGDIVKNALHETVALVSSIESDTELIIDSDIMAHGDSYEIFESGGTVGGSGHVQRDWLVNAVNASTAKWKFIVSELPFLHDETMGKDKWADYDPLDAQRDYLLTHIISPNVIWIGADRHFAGLDDGSHPEDPWPSVGCPNLSCDTGKNATGSWFVNGQVAKFDMNDGASGGFALIKVRSDQVIVQMINPDGSLMHNGICDLEMTVPLN